MPETAQSMKPIPIETEQRRVLRVAKVVSATIGKTFFRALVEHLAKALGGDCAYLAEVAEGPVGRCRTVAAYRDGAYVPDFEQELAGTAASQVLIDGAVAWSRGAARIFPLDTLLGDLNAEGFAGVRLRDSTGDVLGLIAVISAGPLRNPPLAKSVLETFAPRTAAELERKRAEDSLRETDERYRAFISSSPDAMWRIEFARPIPLWIPEEEQIEQIYRYGYLAECNPAMARLAGARTPEELHGTLLSALFPSDDGRGREELRTAARSGYSSATFATTPRDENGRVQYRLRTQCGIVENNELRRIWGTTRDITELKRAEMAVEAAERRFREVLEHIQLPALMLDTKGTITFCNESLARLADAAESLIGKDWLELIDSPQEREIWSSLLSPPPDSGSSQRHFEAVLHPHGAPPRLIAWDTIQLRNEDGEPAGLAAIGRDLTEQKALEARALQAEKLDSIGRLAAGFAHDFNNLLTLVMGYLSMIEGQVDASQPLARPLAAVHSAVDQCANLTQQLLAIGRKQRLRPELCSLNFVIAADEAIIVGIIGEKNRYVTNLSPSLALVHADPVQIRRVLENLATNARDAMPQGGTLTVTTSNVDLRAGDAAFPNDVPAGRYVRLSVSDTGSGFTAEAKEHMFDPFFTTKPRGKGTGLGLATIYGIVAQSGGYISARSERGSGTTIDILLPIRDDG